VKPGEGPDAPPLEARPKQRRSRERIALAVSLPSITAFIFSSEGASFGFRDYAVEFLAPVSSPYFPTDLEFEGTPSKLPLLALAGKSEVKLAVESFGLILSYLGHGSGKSPSPKFAKKLAKLAVANAGVRDEVFCQLVKQTTRNQDRGALARAWELFLIIATIVPSSPAAAPHIRAHVAHQTRGKDAAVAELAQFTLIRFCARFELGQPLSPLSTAVIAAIPRQLSAPLPLFGASIYEQLWAQRAVHPRLPVPLLLHLLLTAALARGAEQTEGVFRRSGNARRVQDVITAVNRGADPAAAFAPNACAAAERAPDDDAAAGAPVAPHSAAARGQPRASADRLLPGTKHSGNSEV
jgi:hypothetical protein